MSAFESRRIRSPHRFNEHEVGTQSVPYDTDGVDWYDVGIETLFVGGEKPMRVLRSLCAIAVVATLLTTANSICADVYELRTYTTNPGKLDNLNARFRDHTVALFKKHGMESVGYWVPADGPKSQNTLIYVLKHKSRDAAKASWKAFVSDPAWKKVAQESQVDGAILAKRPESVYMSLTDYTPKLAEPEEAVEAGDMATPAFELRIYRCNKGKLGNLDARFRDHTIGLFKKHGIESIAYWHPADEPASTDTLIYIIKHANREAAKASWKAFGSDPAWKKVARESQAEGKFLRERPESVYMVPTDYSAIQ